MDFVTIGIVAAVVVLGGSFIPFGNLAALLPQKKTNRIANLVEAIEHIVAAADYCRDCGCDEVAADLESEIPRIAACRGAK